MFFRKYFLRFSISLFFIILGFAGHVALSADVTPTPDTLTFISGNDFKDKVDEAKTPIILDFWAVWCRPCQVYSPVIADVSKIYQNKMVFYKVNVSDFANNNAVQNYSIESIPTVLVIENGEVVERWEGMFTEKELKSKLKQVWKKWARSQGSKS